MSDDKTTEDLPPALLEQLSVAHGGPVRLPGGRRVLKTTQLEAARRVVEVAKRYRDWIFGATITPNDKVELIEAIDAYEAALTPPTPPDAED